jgi:hypothetical protein
MSAAAFHEANSRYPFNTTAGYDFRAWAKRIIYRHEQGDKTLHPFQIPLAYEAMGREVPKRADAI